LEARSGTTKEAQGRQLNISQATTRKRLMRKVARLHVN
jgi:hypothetical protein